MDSIDTMCLQSDRLPVLSCETWAMRGKCGATIRTTNVSSWAECNGVEGSSYSFSNGVIPALCRDRLLHFYRIHEMPRMFIRGIFTLPDNSESLTVTSVAIKKTFQWLRPYFVLATKFHSPWQGRHPSRASGTFSFVRFRKIDTYKYL